MCLLGFMKFHLLKWPHIINLVCLIYGKLCQIASPYYRKLLQNKIYGFRLAYALKNFNYIMCKMAYYRPLLILLQMRDHYKRQSAL